MDDQLINNIRNDIYIPATPEAEPETVPVHHPTLIMQDQQTDTTHHLPCGCCGKCIRDAAWWCDPATGAVKQLDRHGSVSVVLSDRRSSSGSSNSSSRSSSSSSSERF